MALSDNLIHYYKLDGNSNDAVGSNNGSDTNITYSAGNGILGQGAGMNGASSSIHLTAFSWPSNSSVSLSFWVKKTNDTGNQAFISQDDGTTRVISAINAAGSFTCSFFGPNVATPAITCSTGAWHHIVVLWDDTNQIARAYLDGSQVGTGTSGTGHLSTSLQAMWFGEDLFGGGRWFYNGAMDEIGVWNRALSGTEISQLYNSGTGLQYPFVLPAGGTLPLLGV